MVHRSSHQRHRAVGWGSCRPQEARHRPLREPTADHDKLGEHGEDVEDVEDEPTASVMVSRRLQRAEADLVNASFVGESRVDGGDCASAVTDGGGHSFRRA